MAGVKQVVGDIQAGRFLPLYLLLGKETYFKDMVLKIIRREFVGITDNDAGFARIDSQPAALKEAISLLEMPALFCAGRRIVLIDEPAYLKPVSRDKEKDKGDDEQKKSNQKQAKEAMGQDLLQNFWEKNYFSDKTPTNIIVLRSDDTDRRKKLYRILEKHGAVIDCTPLSGDELKRWTEDQLKKYGCTINNPALEKLILATEGNMMRLDQEAKKIASYMGDEKKTVTEDIIEIMVKGNPQANIFRFVDALGENKPGQAWREIQTLFLHNEHPLKILSMIIRQYRLILEMHSLQNEGIPVAKTAPMLNIAPFVAKKLTYQVRLYQKKELRKIFSDLQKTDFAIKTGKLEARLALELLVIRLADSVKHGHGY